MFGERQAAMADPARLILSQKGVFRRVRWALEASMATANDDQLWGAMYCTMNVLRRGTERWGDIAQAVIDARLHEVVPRALKEYHDRCEQLAAEEDEMILVAGRCGAVQVGGRAGRGAAPCWVSFISFISRAVATHY